MPDRTLLAAGLRAFARSHPGLQRDHNEDRHYADAERGLFMVIDGVGGHAAGEKAAETALAMLRARLDRETATPADRIREAITLANNEIHALAGGNPEWQGMACVLTVALVHEGAVTVGHVGDSRLYKLRDGGLRKVTRDHSPVGEREDRGEIGELEAMRHPRRNEIYRDVGSDRHEPFDPEFIDIEELPFEPDAALLLCSDGLTDLVPAARIREIVYAHAGNRPGVVHRLIEAANQAGGKDNVTVVYVEGAGFAEAARAVTGRAGSPGGSHRRGVRLRLAPGRWARSLWRPGLALFLIGCLAGLALALVAVATWRSVAVPWLAHGPRLAWSRTWTVGPPGADFASISDALLAARSGDTVVVEPGEYREGLRFPGGVALVARRPHAAVLRPPPDAVPGWIAIAADAVAGGRIAGLAVAGDDRGVLDVGLQLTGASIDVDDLEISGAERAGIEIAGPGAAVVRACLVHDNPGAGVIVGPGSTPRLLHNVITGNGTRPGSMQPGLQLGEGARPVLFGNILRHNGADGIAGLPAGLGEAALRDNAVGMAPAAPAGRGKKGERGK